jgi:ABC-type antimicrobial peptide transport system permease subunit
VLSAREGNDRAHGGEVGAAYGHFVISREVQHRAPWLLLPGLFIIVTVLAFSSVGDGLRDAANPYAT